MHNFARATRRDRCQLKSAFPVVYWYTYLFKPPEHTHFPKWDSGMGAGASGCAGVSSVVSEADGSNQSDQDHQEQAWHIGDLGYTSFEAHFEAGRMLGKGSFGRVRIARYRRNDYQYAVKILGKDEMIRLQQVGNVKAEKRIMQMADHPSLIALAGSLQDTVFLYLVLELAHGGDLFQYLRRMERFPVPTARFYAAQVVLGLEHLHSLGVVYRDLKPENLMLDRLGNIKITDFGFAKVSSMSCRRH